MTGMKLFIVFLALAAVTASPTNVQNKLPRFGVHGGQMAKLGEVPFVASIQSCFRFACESLCGGVILNERWVLTTVECARLDVQRVLVGVVHLNDTGSYKQLIDITKTVVHPDYKKDKVGVNDLALLKVRTPFMFNEKILRPAKLPEQDSEPSGTVDLAGYGNSEYQDYNILNVVRNLPLIDLKECQERLKNDNKHHEVDAKSNFCAGDLNKESNNCMHDEGSPVFQNDTLIGITAWSYYPCDSKGIPDVYVKISPFVNWIKEIIEA